MTAYCSAAELKTQIEKSGSTGSGSSDALDVLITAASEAIDHYCNRKDGFVATNFATARHFAGNGKPWMYIDETPSITTVSMKLSPTDDTYTALAATDWVAFSGDPELPDFDSLPYRALMMAADSDYSVFTSGRFVTRGGFRPSSNVARSVPTVEVTSRWGYALTVPPAIKQATIALSARWLKQGQSAWADTLASAELGQLIYQRENYDIRMMLDRFYHPSIGAR